MEFDHAGKKLVFSLQDKKSLKGGRGLPTLEVGLPAVLPDVSWFLFWFDEF
jgi:hypothetical protein